MPTLAARAGRRAPLPAEPPAATLLSRVEALEAGVGTLLALQVLRRLSCSLRCARPWDALQWPSTGVPFPPIASAPTPVFGCPSTALRVAGALEAMTLAKGLRG